MDTLKTAIVVILLLAVLYGVYVTLNQPDQEIPEDIAWAQQEASEPLQVDFGEASGGAPNGVTASLDDSASWNAETAGHDTHDDAMAGTTLSTDTGSLPGGGYAAAPETAAATDGVAAPKLISAGTDGPPNSPEMRSQAGESAPYPTPSGTFADQTAGTTNGYQAGSAIANQATDATPPTVPPANSNASVYAPAQPDSSPPSGSYGSNSALSGNAPLVADAQPPVGDAYAAPVPPPAPETGPPASSSRIESVLATAQTHVEQGQHYEALFTLSLAYDAPGISPEERQQLQTWLDPLAGKVIYSKEHLIGAPYQLQAGESLESVAAKHKVPWQLLANINGIREPASIQPGTSIKVVPGPFHAEVDVTSRALTLFAGKLYAGRFSIQVNSSNLPAAGEYQVNDKQPGHSYYAGNAQTLAPQDPQNPYGGVWIDLGRNVSIHGTSTSPDQSARLGCISLQPNDANDLYGILSRGSNVIIRR